MNGPSSNAEWTTSICACCPDSPCCNYLPLFRMNIDTKDDLDQLIDILSTPWFEAGLYETGLWMLFYRATCTSYDALTTKCLIHGHDQQPEICRVYAPHDCWYRSAYADRADRNFIRFDKLRMERLAAMIICDFAGRIAKVPDWDTMFRLANESKLDRLRYPTSAAQAYGAVRLRLRTPRTTRQWSIMKFRLGFPDIRLFASDRAWFAQAPSTRPGLTVYPDYSPAVVHHYPRYGPDDCYREVTLRMLNAGGSCGGTPCDGSAASSQTLQSHRTPSQNGSCGLPPHPQGSRTAS